MLKEFSASVWQEDDWYIAQCREVDVASQGKTEEEALQNLHEALELGIKREPLGVGTLVYQ